MAAAALGCVHLEWTCDGSAMLKTCFWTLLTAALFAATVWYYFGDVTPTVWHVAAAVSTSNGDLAWSGGMVLVAFAFLRIGRKARNGG